MDYLGYDFKVSSKPATWYLFRGNHMWTHKTGRIVYGYGCGSERSLQPRVDRPSVNIQPFLMVCDWLCRQKLSSSTLCYLKALHFLTNRTITRRIYHYPLIGIAKSLFLYEFSLKNPGLLPTGLLLKVAILSKFCQRIQNIRENKKIKNVKKARNKIHEPIQQFKKKQHFKHKTTKENSKTTGKKTTKQQHKTKNIGITNQKNENITKIQK